MVRTRGFIVWFVRRAGLGSSLLLVRSASAGADAALSSESIIIVYLGISAVTLLLASSILFISDAISSLILSILTVEPNDAFPEPSLANPAVSIFPAVESGSVKLR